MQTNSLSLELRQELDSSRFLVTLIITGLMGIASFQALPSLILGFVSELGFSERQIGQLSTFQLLGLGLGSIASVILLKFLDWRNLVRFGLALLLISDFAAALNIKMGRILPLSVGLTFQLIGLLLLSQGFNYLLFSIATVLFCFGWYMYVPYQFALLAEFDRDGRPMLLLNAVAGLGSGLGPAIAAYTLAGGYSLLYILCALFLAVSLVWHLTAINLGKNHL